MSAERADKRGGTAVPRTGTTLPGEGVGRSTEAPPDDAGRLTRAAWESCTIGWRLAAVAVAVAALASTAHAAVPLASGVGVAALVPAALVDRRWERLPDPLVAAAAALLVLVATLEARAGVVIEVRDAALGVAVLAGPLLVLHLLSPESMGFGDVKAGVVLGAALGLVDWQVALAALAVSTAVTAMVGVARRARTVPFGPGLVAGASVSLVLAMVLVPVDGDDPRARVVPPRAPVVGSP